MRSILLMRGGSIWRSEYCSFVVAPFAALDGFALGEIGD
jgi:hypothetical protein